MYGSAFLTRERVAVSVLMAPRLPLAVLPGFLLLLPLQEVLMDGKRESTISQLLITPTDLDIGRVYVCRCSNDAIPAGKEASIKLNVHRKESCFVA